MTSMRWKESPIQYEKLNIEEYIYKKNLKKKKSSNEIKKTPIKCFLHSLTMSMQKSGRCPVMPKTVVLRYFS